MPPFFDNRKFTPLSEPASIVLSALNWARTEDDGTCSIHAGPRGYSMKVCRKIVARGSTPDELLRSFQKAQEKARAAK